mgnify:FL=1
MTTWTALTTAPGRAEAEALGEALEGLPPAPSALAVLEIEDGAGLWEVGAYYEARPDAVALDLLAAAHGARGFAVAKLEDRDWVAQVRRELAPVEAGRFVVHGGHDAARVPSNRIGLRIEAAMAFGTGHHGTTRGCLLALERLIRVGFRPANALDLGSGTGVLAMGAAAALRAPVLATDLDPVAVATARENARANRLAPWVRVIRSDGVASPEIRAGAPYDLVFANILARPLRRLAPGVARVTAPGGVAILSGLLDAQATGVEGVWRGHGFAPRFRLRGLGGWTTLALERI